ncbi:MAG: tRNA (adenosine(37)-N6)-threonylcarbamoyltransferase complex ATPase subunit type 1 TsaE [Candidatus Staskawiczbacteria bacterium]|nr:tRNA (adenosine(37)-N6)-threonylcarbamoyltransferase complex ATPase subunit type 1 TsaE [Candidatus Staskawiczbacteria bacterium]
MKNKKIISANSGQTKKLGEKLAKEILMARLGEKAAVLALDGNLGSGKTTFLQGFAKGLKIKEKILSPTFIIFRKIKIPGRKNFLFFYHFDCYRVKKKKEIMELGFEKIISGKKNIVAIEWPKSIKNMLPKQAVILKFRFIDKSSREVIINMQK